MKKLIQFEFRKIFQRRLTQAALVFVVLVSLLYSVAGYRNMYAFDGVSREGSGRDAVEIDKAVAEKYAGLLTDEKVRQIMSDFKPRVDLHGMNAAYLYQNATQSAAFVRFSDLEGNWNGLTVSDVFGEEEIKIGYINGWLQTSGNLVRVFVVLALAIVVMTAPVFSGEYGGVDNIILTSRYGKTKCAAAKAVAGGLAALLATAAVSALNLAIALALYGTDGLDCSILFAPSGLVEEYIPFNITCGALLGYQVLLAFTCAASVTGITLALSALCKSQAAALAASAAACLLPILLPVSETSPLFRYIALLPLYHVQFVSLMSIEQFGGGMLYAIFAVPVAVVLMGAGALLSGRIFARRQVS